MPAKPTSVVAAWVFFFALEFAALTVSAQMVGLRDLTSGTRAPAERISVPETCAQSGSSIANDGASGNSVNAGADENPLEVTIVAISPSPLEIGNDFTAKVRLKNNGAKAVLVPSVTDGERVLGVSTDSTEEKYEVGDVSFRLMTGKDHRIPVFLNSGGALFANPDDKGSYLPLEPGNWLEIKLEGIVECGLEDCLAEIRPDNKAALTAWWYQRVLSHRINGCDETHASAKVREASSAPFSVAIRNPPSKSAKAAPKK
jgi:hypothetical protein